MAARYPVTIKLSNALIEEFDGCEYGIWEDHGRPDDGLLKDPCPACEERCTSAPFTHNILQRYRTRIEVHTVKEAEEVYWAVSSGTFQINHLRAARRIADELLAAGVISDELREQWYPSGA